MIVRKLILTASVDVPKVVYIGQFAIETCCAFLLSRLLHRSCEISESAEAFSEAGDFGFQVSDFSQGVVASSLAI